MGPSKRPSDSTRARKAHPPKKPRRKPVPPPSNVPVGALRGMKAALDRICSVAIVVAHALREQAVELDGDAADILRWYVSDPLHEQIERIERLLKGGAV